MTKFSQKKLRFFLGDIRDKYEILGGSDGEVSDEEAKFSGSYIAGLPGMTEKRYNSIRERFTREAETALVKAKDLKEDDKIELITSK